jgi:hypothetical protein
VLGSALWDLVSERDEELVLIEGCYGSNTWLVSSFLVAIQCRLDVHLDAVASPQIRKYIMPLTGTTLMMLRFGASFRSGRTLYEST